MKLGAYDHRILLWLAGYEPSTCAVIAGLISRAHAGLTAEQMATVLDALDVAADYKRDRPASCPDCEVSSAELCGTCEWRLARAEEYDALAETLRGSGNGLRWSSAGQRIRRRGEQPSKPRAGIKP